MDRLQQTPLFPIYKEYSARTIDFGGWELPVQFSSIKEEHEAVRTAAGLFDVSHMGEIVVTGQDSLSFLQYVTTNDVSVLRDGAVQYTTMCYENGGTVDDLLLYRKKEHEYLLVVNASNIQKDYEWLLSHVQGDVVIENVSQQTALLAIQGPKAAEILQTVTSENLKAFSPFTCKAAVEIGSIRVLLSRTGYTGEDGFELYCRSEDAMNLWKLLLAAGEPYGLKPCGLGARDTLRFEAALPLYGQELSATITPIEARIGFAVKTNKEVNFLGKAVLQQQKEQGTNRRLVGIEVIGRGIPRTGYEVFVEKARIGEITSGTQSPTLKKNIGLALLDVAYIELGTEVEVEIRGRRVKAIVVSIPFYKRSKGV